MMLKAYLQYLETSLCLHFLLCYSAEAIKVIGFVTNQKNNPMKFCDLTYNHYLFNNLFIDPQ